MWEKTERIIDELWGLVNDQLPVKPRTYRKVAHKRYLNQSKKKKASKASLRKTLRYLLNCVERNLVHIDDMLTMLDGRAFPLAHKYQRLLWVIHSLYDQQRGMYDAASATTALYAFPSRMFARLYAVKVVKASSLAQSRACRCMAAT